MIDTFFVVINLAHLSKTAEVSDSWQLSNFDVFSHF